MNSSERFDDVNDAAVVLHSPPLEDQNDRLERPERDWSEMIVFTSSQHPRDPGAIERRHRPQQSNKESSAKKRAKTEKMR